MNDGEDPHDVRTWLLRKLEQVQSFHGLDGKELGLEFHVSNGEVFRVAIAREDIHHLRRLLDDGEIVLNQNARG